MVPMAFVGPAVSGFSTASIAQSAVTTGASYMVKKNTGKIITEHAFDAIIAGDVIMKQSYFPKEKENVHHYTNFAEVKTYQINKK